MSVGLEGDGRAVAGFAVGGFPEELAGGFVEGDVGAGVEDEGFAEDEGGAGEAVLGFSAPKSFWRFLDQRILPSGALKQKRLPLTTA